MHSPRAAGSGRRTPPPRRRLLTGTVAGATGLALMVAPGSVAQAVDQAAAQPAAHRAAGPITALASSRLSRDFDVRDQGSSAAVLTARARKQNAHPTAVVRSLRSHLGVQGVVSLDPLTGTPRTVAKLDGYLTGPSSRTPSTVVLDYVRSHLGAFGLDRTDLGTLRLRRTYTDVSGIRHLSYVQYSGSVPVFGNGLKANVSRDGRLVSVQGSPVHDLADVGSTPGLGATAARRAAIQDVSGTVGTVRARGGSGSARLTRFSDGDRASLVAFQTVTGPRLAWQTLTTPGRGQMFLHVVDATSGRVLLRRNLVQSDTGAVWDYWPGRSNGGRQNVVDLTAPGWLPNASPRLAGNNTHVYTDVNDDDLAQPREEVTPGTSSFRFPFVDFTKTDGPPCTAGFRCSWNSQVPGSWGRNRKQNAVQVFTYVNRMHDHLFARPIGFNRRAGNFEAIDDDAVQAQPDDGANIAHGLPDSAHTDNANMGTPPDGMPPRMQMYLFNDPADKGQDPFLQSNGGDEADVVYHEYTHGLSNRLVVDPSGVSTIGDVQAGAMGEAWSDWYALDYLNNLGLQRDTATVGDVRMGQYVGKGKDLIRSEPIDCPVGVRSVHCPGTPGALAGGYTYGDFGKISDIGPEVHADGEIWGQTLWDLRKALGSKLTESLVTRAMELSPANPSYLDERNAIVQADTVVNGGSARATIWKVFAHRGMGYFAGAVNGDDAQPVEDFSLPPVAGTPHGYLIGAVTDADSGAPAVGVTVAFGGHASGFPGDYEAVTGADGTYRITGVYAGTYPKVWAGGGGFDRKVRTLSATSGRQTLNWTLRRDWAALAGGASVTDTNDDTGAPYGCGAAAMFDQSQARGWSAERHVVNGVVIPVHVVVELPSAVDVSQVAIDPSGTCGDDPSAAAGPYTLETSTDGTTWTTAASGTFAPADDSRFNSPALAPGSTSGVRYLRYTVKDSQADQVGSCPSDLSGCAFIDSTELEVYGTPPS